MSKELQQLRKDTEKRRVDPITWASRPILFDLGDLPCGNETELALKDNSVYLDEKNKVVGLDEFQQLRGLVLYLQSKLNEHIDKARRKPKGGF